LANGHQGQESGFDLVVAVGGWIKGDAAILEDAAQALARSNGVSVKDCGEI
jgi:hypothetical protein